jgi:hypothetical protein
MKPFDELTRLGRVHRMRQLALAALQVYWNLWATGGTHLYPSLHQEYDERIACTAEFVVRYARQKGGIRRFMIS